MLEEEIADHITIFVCQSPESFGDDATLESNFFEHSWAGGEGEKEYGMELYPARSDWTPGYFSYKRYVPDNKEVPQFKFGTNYRMDYSDNGKPCVPNIEKYVPDFDIGEIYVVLKDCMSYNYYNGDEFEEHKYELIIYVPKGTYDFEPEVKYILDNFNIE